MKNRVLIVRKHIWYYTGLAVLQLLEYVLATLLAYDHQLVMLVIVSMTLLFTGFVLLHHYFEHQLTSKIVLEYVLMGSVGISISFFVFH